MATVLSRWAIITTVFERTSSPIACRMDGSFSGSRAAVARSSSIIGASFRIARTMEMRCLSPLEKGRPPSPRTAWYSAEQAFRKRSTFIRLFRRIILYSGRTFEHTMRLELFSTDCVKCKRLEFSLHQALAEAGIDAELVKISSIAEMERRGLRTVPALAIDGEIVLTGVVPPVAELRRLLTKRA